MHKREADRQQRMPVFLVSLPGNIFVMMSEELTLNLHFPYFWMDVVLPIKFVSGHLIF